MADSPVAEVVLGESDVRALLAEAAPHLAALPLTRVADGWDNTIWRLGDDLSVRLPRRRSAAPLLTNEQRALDELDPLLAAIGIRTPLPVVRGLPGTDFRWPWSVVPWIDGEPALASSRADNALWAASLASALRVLHHDAPADAPHNPVRGRPLATRDAAMLSRLAALDDHPALREAWEDGATAALATERVWIHGDLHPGNILVKDGALHALIDFGDVTAGDPAYDLAAAWMLFDAEGRAVFRRATAGRYDDATWIRARAWAAYIAAALLGHSDDRAEYLAVGADTAEELARDV